MYAVPPGDPDALADAIGRLLTSGELRDRLLRAMRECVAANGYADTTVSKELWLCHTQMGLTMRDLKQLVLSGFKSAFMPFHVKQQHLRKVSEELRAFAEDVSEAPAYAPAAASQRSLA